MRYRDIKTGKYLNNWNGFDGELASYIGTRYLTGIIYKSPDDSFWLPDNFEEFKLTVKAVNTYRRKTSNKRDKTNVTNADIGKLRKLRSYLQAKSFEKSMVNK
jgi:hypothetical protein